MGAPTDAAECAITRWCLKRETHTLLLPCSLWSCNLPHRATQTAAVGCQRLGVRTSRVGGFAPPEAAESRASGARLCVRKGREEQPVLQQRQRLGAERWQVCATAPTTPDCYQLRQQQRSNRAAFAIGFAASSDVDGVVNVRRASADEDKAPVSSLCTCPQRQPTAATPRAMFSRSSCFGMHLESCRASRGGSSRRDTGKTWRPSVACTICWPSAGCWSS